jgi:putative redox protein
MLSIAAPMSQREEGARTVAPAGSIEPVRLTSRRGVSLAGLLHLPDGVGALAERPVVVLCHGMESTKEGAKHQGLAARLGARGYPCLRFDFSYVGESEGRFEDLTISGEVEDLAGACDFLFARGARRLGLIGSSLGGTVAVLFAGREPRVRALVTVAAVARPLGIVERMPKAAVAEWRRRGFREEHGGGRLKRDFLDDLARVDVLAAAGALTAATLVTHGDRDDVVPVGDARALHAALPEPKALAITPGGDHRYSDPAHLAALLAGAVDWIGTHLPLAGAGSRPDAGARP